MVSGHAADRREFFLTQHDFLSRHTSPGAEADGEGGDEHRESALELRLARVQQRSSLRVRHDVGHDNTRDRVGVKHFECDMRHVRAAVVLAFVLVTRS